MCLCHMNMVNLFLSTFFTPVTINIKYRTLYGSPNICPNIQRNIFETSNWFFSIGLSKKGENFPKFITL